MITLAPRFVNLLPAGVALVEFMKDAAENHGWDEAEAFIVGGYLLRDHPRGAEITFIELWDRWYKLDPQEQEKARAA